MRRSPFGNPVLWIVAAFVIPELVKKCKPLAKSVGDALVNAGESFRKASEQTCEVPAEVVVEPEPTEEPATTPKPKKSKPAKEPPVQEPEA